MGKLLRMLCAAGALGLAAPVPVASQTAEQAEKLDTLFAELAQPGRTDWQRIEGEIVRIWSHSGSDAMDLLLERGNAALAAEDYDLALELFARHRAHGCFPNASEHVIHNAYDPPLPPVRRPACVLPTIGFIGRLVAEKGVEQLIAALRRLRERGVDAQLLIAGEGKACYVDALRAAAEGLPVTFVGRQKPHEFFRRIDVTVVPSIWEEPMGRVVVESYANGRPVVMTPTGGLPELASGAAAMVAAGCSADMLADAVATMIERLRNPREDLFDAATRSSANFGSGEMAARYEAVYLRAMADSAASRPLSAKAVSLEAQGREGS